MFHLFDRRERLLSTCSRNARLVLREVEVVRVGVLNPRLVPTLESQPLEEPLQVRQRCVPSGDAQLLSGDLTGLLGKVALEGDRLIDAEQAEVTELGVRL